jgi:hypothetical protein
MVVEVKWYHRLFVDLPTDRARPLICQAGDLQREIVLVRPEPGNDPVGLFGKGSIDAALKAVRGGKLDREVWIPSQLVTEPNMAQFENLNSLGSPHGLSSQITARLTASP